MPRVPVLLVALLASLPVAAQTADLTLRLEPEARYNGGQTGFVRATVTNLGPDAAMNAGVRLTKPSTRFVGATSFGCIEFPDTILCNIASAGAGTTLAAGQAREFLVPFVPPDAAGTFTLTGRTESFTLDPNHDNDAASASAEVVSLSDLGVRIANDVSLRPGKASHVYLYLTDKAALRPASVSAFITIPEPLVVTKDYSPVCVEVDGAAPDTYRCTFPNFGRDGNGYAVFEVQPSRTSPPVTITASIDSAEPDWNPDDNRTSFTAAVYDVHDLDIRITSPDTLDGENRTIVQYAFTNTADVPATNVSAEIITYPADADPTAAGDGWTCKPATLYRLACTHPSIAPHATSTLRLPVRFSAHEIRGAFVANVMQKPSPEFTMIGQSVQVDAVFYRPFRVTNTADSGPGSLRQAILDANAVCSSDDATPPCSIRFEVPAPVPAEGWFTITPRSPLPRLTVTDLMVDGDAQTALTGNTNPAGPEIFLFGGEAGEGHGLDLNPAASVVRGLAIGGFRGNAILSTARQLAFAPRHQVVERNYLGTDPTGTTAVPNGLRAFMAAGFSGEITANVMSGNRRSGIFLSAFGAATIRDNRIGVAASSDEPLGNGASGIFVGDNCNAVIEHNVIANDADFGVALARFSSAQVLENRIFHNVQPGIDVGLDGPTLEAAPRITSARFDAASGETIVEGVIEQPPITYAIRTLTAYVYANTRDEAGGEIFLGSVRAAADGRFTVRYHGDLTGKFLDAMRIQLTDFGDLIARESSEFGPRLKM
jgi:hypothetical protein